MPIEVMRLFWICVGAGVIALIIGALGLRFYFRLLESWRKHKYNEKPNYGASLIIGWGSGMIAAWGLIIELACIFYAINNFIQWKG